MERSSGQVWSEPRSWFPDPAYYLPIIYKILSTTDRTFAFILALGYVTEEWYANAAGALKWGFPTIADILFQKFYQQGYAPKVRSKAAEIKGLEITYQRLIYLFPMDLLLMERG